MTSGLSCALKILARFIVGARGRRALRAARQLRTVNEIEDWE
jgi:hypothetical protein